MKVHGTSNLLRYQCGRKARCCYGWDILFSKDVIRRIEEAPFGTFPHLEKDPVFHTVVNPENPLYHARVKMVDGHCVFLGDDQECQVFQAFGLPRGNPVCLAYPFTRMRLPDRIAITTALSCTSEIERLFDDCPVRIVPVPEGHNQSDWYLLDFSKKDHVVFHGAKRLSWPGFFLLEQKCLALADANTPSSKWMAAWSGLFKDLLTLPRDTLGPDDVGLAAVAVPVGRSTSGASFLDTLRFFIQRKIRLYHNPEFETLTRPLLTLAADDFHSRNTARFQEALHPFEPVLARYFAIKLFANTANFMSSVALCWHTVGFYIAFIQASAFVAWRAKGSLEKEDLKQSIRCVERHFFHDSRMFMFWGQGRRGRSEFHPESLALLRFPWPHGADLEG